MEQQNYRFFASCALGLEPLIVRELKDFGGREIEAGRGRVQWRGNLESGYRACLWSRFSSRILMALVSFEMRNADDLYKKCLTFDWQNCMNVKSSFAVDCTLSPDAVLDHNKFAALRVKDGLVDYFRDLTGDRPSVASHRPDVQFHLHLAGSEAVLSLDLSGESLHRRGYRVAGGMAPLKETLAAAIVALSGLPDNRDVPAIIDPMCGTGTLLIEAALMLGDVAPGLFRQYFGFFGWKGHDESLWQELVDEAVEREEAGLDRRYPFMMGYDADPVVVGAARKNIVKAGLDEIIQIKCAELAGLGAPAEKGLMLCNLPYGERLSETDKVRYLYSAMGRIGREKFTGWQFVPFISNPELAESFRVKWQSKKRLFNGPINCRLLSGYFEKSDEKDFVWQLRDFEVQKGLEDFANRLRKNVKKYLKWARKERITCFRIYDRDLPEYNISVDLYEKWIHVQEFAPPKSVEAKLAEERFNGALRVIREMLGVRTDRVFLKRRERQKGKKQYQKRSDNKKMYPVREGNAHLLVNFRDYLDTGLFLDHRPIRLRIAREARGKRFLNLFAYTATATVHAALGGAVATTTVDLSGNYLNWAKMNLAFNGLAENNHRVVKADCMRWLKEEKERYDLIFVDPPTFSNTRKEQRIFDIQRDHVALIKLAMKRLDRGGLLIFSTNFRKFKLDKKLAEQFEIKQISQDSIPFDFSRNSKIHFCWEFYHR